VQGRWRALSWVVKTLAATGVQGVHIAASGAVNDALKRAAVVATRLRRTMEVRLTRSQRRFWPAVRRAAIAAAWLGCILGGHNAAAALPDLAGLPTCPPAAQTCIALHLIAPAEADVRDWVALQVETANDRLAVIGAAIEVVSVSALPAGRSDLKRVADRDALDPIGGRAPLRWFVVERLVDSGEPGRLRKGVTWRRGGGVYVIVASDAWRWVLAHELGHVLGLGHSREAASIMNKAPRAWPPPWQIGFTARERPVMRRTLARLLRAGTLTVAADRADGNKRPRSPR